MRQGFAVQEATEKCPRCGKERKFNRFWSDDKKWRKHKTKCRGHKPENRLRSHAV